MNALEWIWWKINVLRGHTCLTCKYRTPTGCKIWNIRVTRLDNFCGNWEYYFNKEFKIKSQRRSK